MAATTLVLLSPRQVCIRIRAHRGSLLKASPDPLVSQFRATYTTLLNLLDAYGTFAGVREIAERSFAYRDFARQLHQLEKLANKANKRLPTG